MRNHTKIAIIGTGNIGEDALSSLMHAYYYNEAIRNELGPLEVVLLNRTVDKARGVYEDSTDMFGNEMPDTFKLTVSEDWENFSDVARSDVVISAVGAQREKGELRPAVLKKNARPTAEIGYKLRGCYAGQNPPLYIEIGNPLDAKTWISLMATGFPPEFAIGLAGKVDTGRFDRYLAEKFGVSRKKVATLVGGTHDEEGMVPFLSLTTIDGVSLNQDMTDRNMPSHEIAEVIQTVRDMGAKIKRLRGNDSARKAPGALAVKMSLAYLRGQGDTFTACRQVPAGFWGIEQPTCIGVPGFFDENGFQLEKGLDISSDERTAFQTAAAVVTGLNGDAAAFLAAGAILGTDPPETLPIRAEIQAIFAGATVEKCSPRQQLVA